jgi:hypothetical protein
MTVWDLFFTDQTPWGKDRRGANIEKRKEIVKKALRVAASGKDYKQTVFDQELAKSVREQLQRFLEKDKTFADDFAPILSKLEELEKAAGESYAAGTTLSDIVQDLNDQKHSSIWIIQAHNPHEMRRFAKQLGNTMYESRRMDGIIEPLVSFVFDEADEFIPQKKEGEKTYKDSREIVETLARRGRKFGLGVGIATQRARYLDTSIMAQPHTYLVSKLPRKSDRDAVAEAFGISEDMFRQTFKFRAGNWLLMSHDATGLRAIPVPIQTEDANERIRKYLETLKE